MAGTRGPVPKRSDQRVRRNKQETPTATVTAIGAVQVPDLGIEDPHPLVKDLYESLGRSAQSRFYEPSDWAYARVALHFLSDLLKSSKPNGQLLTTVNAMLTGLLVSEGDRRRVQLEIERNQADAVVVDVAAMFAKQLGAQLG